MCIVDEKEPPVKQDRSIILDFSVGKVGQKYTAHLDITVPASLFLSRQLE